MAMDIIPKALYPLVPAAPGVPALLRSGAAILDTATLNKLGIGSALDSLIGTDARKWGIFYDDGSPVILAESVIAIDYDKSARLSQYPIENGKFATYNKVENPYSVRLRMSCGMSVDDRTDFLVQLENAAKGLDLLTVVTPEYTYHDANVNMVGYRRDSENGANRIVVDVHITEVRQVESSAYSAPNDPMSLGQLQPVSDVTVDLSGVV